jgi:acyl carrier protein
MTRIATMATTKHDCEQQVRLAPPVTAAQIRAFLARIDSVIDFDKLEDTTPFTEAGADSLDFFNIISEIQTATGLDIANQDVEQVNTLAGLVAYLNARMI